MESNHNLKLPISNLHEFPIISDEQRDDKDSAEILKKYRSDFREEPSAA